MLSELRCLPQQLPEKFPHGGGVEAAAKAWGCAPDDIVDLSAGLHPSGPPAWLAAWLAEHAGLVGRYPDTHGEPARSALAAEYGVPSECVLVTAGAQAAIEAVFQAFGWRSMAIQTPCYAEPIRCAVRSGCRVTPFHAGEVVPDADILWWTSPHNPTGLLEPMPKDAHGVLDESYMPISMRRTLGVMPGVMRIGSLTKGFCIPGLRLGYVIGAHGDIQRLKAWLPPWPAPTWALHLLPALLPEADARDASISANCAKLMTLLRCHDWHVIPSSASFVLAKPQGRKPDFIRERILVRSFPEWPELAGHVRFGIPSDEKSWHRLEQALCPSR